MGFQDTKGDLMVKKCDNCGRAIKPKETRYLVYRHHYVTELVSRFCEKCWKGGLECG